MCAFFRRIKPLKYLICSERDALVLPFRPPTSQVSFENFGRILSHKPFDGKVKIHLLIYTSLALRSPPSPPLRSQTVFSVLISLFVCLFSSHFSFGLHVPCSSETSNRYYYWHECRAHERQTRKCYIVTVWRPTHYVRSKADQNSLCCLSQHSGVTIVPCDSWTNKSLIKQPLQIRWLWLVPARQWLLTGVAGEKRKSETQSMAGHWLFRSEQNRVARYQFQKFEIHRARLRFLSLVSTMFCFFLSRRSTSRLNSSETIF